AYIILTIIIVIASILLVGIVLIQKSKGGGLSENFNQGNTIMSVKSTTDLVEKITWGLMAFIGILCLATVFFKDEAIEQKVQKTEVDASSVKLPVNNTPNVESTAAPVEQGAATIESAPAE
ncbi:MAG: preprotein translocase subunit SecG, partial [Bacteroidales bacterium]|nr:preprotein translocase subunit SecG [Candidatus Physcocola equi]